jgi:hypothetical protein
VSTPPYAPPSVGPAGLLVSSYPSILADNLTGFLNIYGQTQDVAPDTAIFQFLSIISLKNSDVNLGLQLVYNQSSPQTAIGAGLDRQLKMNGLAREVFTFSTAPATLTGTPGAVLTNAFGQDQAGNLWALPSPITLTGGTASTTVTCTTPGSVAAEEGSINIVATPMNGWTPPVGTITNTAAATLGDPVEADSSARARQAVSVALPGLTPIASTVAACLSTAGVLRVSPGFITPGGPGTSIENPTGAVDSPWGNPAHSISMVVEGGTDAAVGLSIYLKKTIGCFTNGTTSVVVTDPTIPSYPETISFFRPTNVSPFVGVYIHGLNGFTTATVEAVQTAVLLYLDSLAIGAAVDYSAVYGTIMAVNPSLVNPIFKLVTLTLGLSAIGLFTVVPGTAAGTGYVVGDVLTVVQAGGSGGTVTVTTVAAGVITGINPQVTTPGTGYAVGSALATTGGHGTGATVNVTAVQPAGLVDLTLAFTDAALGTTANVVVAGV